SRPPEFIRVGVDYPVRAVLGRCEACHPCDPLALPEPLGRLANEVENTVSRVGLEELRGSVSGDVVRGDNEVDPRVQVKRDLGVDDIGLVPGQYRQDELHGPREALRRSSLFAAPRSLPSMRTLGRRSIVSRRCSSVSSLLCRRTTSASPSAATSTAYAASSTTVGRGKASPFPSCNARSASRRRVSMTSEPSARPRSSASSSTTSPS